MAIKATWPRLRLSFNWRVCEHWPRLIFDTPAAYERVSHPRRRRRRCRRRGHSISSTASRRSRCGAASSRGPTAATSAIIASASIRRTSSSKAASSVIAAMAVEMPTLVTANVSAALRVCARRALAAVPKQPGQSRSDLRQELRATLLWQVCFCYIFVFICCQFADHALNLHESNDESDDNDDRVDAAQSDGEELDPALNDDEGDLDSQTEDEAPTPKRARGGKN